MVFSANVDMEKRQTIMNLWNSSQLQQYENYLGLPPLIGRSKTTASADIKHRVWLKLQGRKGNMFSQGGMEILLKAIALAIPSYAMSCFKLPAKLCSEIESMMARYWWRQKNEEKNVHWISWKRTCQSKSIGGMGFKDLEIFNMAMLAKQAWRLLQNKESLFHEMYAARQELFAESNNQREEQVCQLKDQVSSLIDPSTNWWNLTKVRALFNPKIAEVVLRIHPRALGYMDKWMSEHEKSSNFSIKSAYIFFKIHLEHDCGETLNGAIMKKFWNSLWRLRIPHKVKVFAWKACKESLPSKANLINRKLDISGQSYFCKHQMED
ncbi:uncharacterized protein LOC121235437 [Juglans microcarpa x Juglans regia]|uniref:uncharacterized protein LOC121235437 n=1 Tax=Juglans microcarpa x Juglans regia TaxID=2249226 RepID=UPI001B7D9A67|nr:uncharacterized protein LOC121235437 [Juglans microcarpa x Juglans regia]